MVACTPYGLSGRKVPSADRVSCFPSNCGGVKKGVKEVRKAGRKEGKKKGRTKRRKNGQKMEKEGVKRNNGRKARGREEWREGGGG
jgi:hypothetical protein